MVKVSIETVYVHETANIHPDVQIEHFVVIGPYVTIDKGVRIGSHSVIGGRPEHGNIPGIGWESKVLGVHIHKNTVISESVTVHSGIKDKTKILEGTHIHNHSHIGHDSVIGAGVTIGGHTTIAGHVRIMDKAWVSGQNSMHQWCVIGAYAFLGAGSFLKGHIPPGEKWMANPARPAGENSVGLLRAEMTFNDCRDKYDEEFKHLVSLSRLP